MGKKIDLTGQRFGRLLILEEELGENRKKNRVTWKCQCDCGNIVYRDKASLDRSEIPSCGCVRIEKLIKRNAESSTVKIGNKYGKLTVIEDLGFRKQNSRDKRERWSLCQCDCGSKPIEVKNNMLQNGWKKSCGCLNGSYGEYVIELLLNQFNVPYQKQYYFKDLYILSPNAPLRFDFAIMDENNQLKYLIEFDGEQHYFSKGDVRWGGEENVKETQERDRVKNEYVKEHNIPLIRIPYTVRQELKIEDLLLETTDFLLK